MQFWFLVIGVVVRDSLHATVTESTSASGHSHLLHCLTRESKMSTQSSDLAAEDMPPSLNAADHLEDAEKTNSDNQPHSPSSDAISPEQTAITTTTTKSSEKPSIPKPTTFEQLMAVYKTTILIMQKCIRVTIAAFRWFWSVLPILGILTVDAIYTGTFSFHFSRTKVSLP
jgi:hypothetical protein